MSGYRRRSEIYDRSHHDRTQPRPGPKLARRRQLPGRLVSTIQGSTETTFYVLAVYFGSVGIKNTRHAVGCGLAADLAGFIGAVLVTYLFFG